MTELNKDEWEDLTNDLEDVTTEEEIEKRIENAKRFLDYVTIPNEMYNKIVEINKNPKPLPEKTIKVLKRRMRINKMYRPPIEGIELRLNNITKGMWKAELTGNQEEAVRVSTFIPSNKINIIICECGSNNADSDAIFISYAPTDIQQLIKYVKDLELENHVLRAERDDAENDALCKKNKIRELENRLYEQNRKEDIDYLVNKGKE